MGRILREPPELARFQISGVAHLRPLVAFPIVADERRENSVFAI